MSKSSLIKRKRVKYLEREQRNLGNVKREEPTKIVPQIEQCEEKILKTDQFCIRIKQENGSVLGMEIAHQSGDSISLDFAYNDRGSL